MDTKKGTMIFTYDNVIGDSEYNLYRFLMSNLISYYRYFNLYNIETKEKLNKRKERNILKYLIKDNIKNNQFQINNLYITLLDKYYSQNIYSEYDLTKLAKNTLMNPLLTQNQGIKEIYILIKYKLNKEKEYKEKFLSTIFKNEKIKLIFLKENEKYSDYIKNIYYTIITTDDLSLIEEEAKKNIDHKEFLIPRFGYNISNNRLEFLIREKGGSLTYYDPID